jgi:hypothetical protein
MVEAIPLPPCAFITCKGKTLTVLQYNKMLKYQNNVRPTMVTIIIVISCHTLFYLLKVGFMLKKHVFEVLVDRE